MERDFTCVVIVEKTEGLHHFFAGVSFGHLLGHHFCEFVIFNDTGTVLIDIGDHFLNFFALGFETKGAHGDFEFFLINVA
jgi:hypothetical protein